MCSAEGLGRKKVPIKVQNDAKMKKMMPTKLKIKGIKPYIFYLHKGITNGYANVSQPGCWCTLKCREIVAGVPPVTFN